MKKMTKRNQKTKRKFANKETIKINIEQELSISKKK